MANTATATISIAGNTSILERDIQRALSKLESSSRFTPKINTNSFSLGRITGEVDDFNKSLDAANKRVLAFGANAAVIGGIYKAFNELTKSTIAVDKALTNINSVFNLSEKNLKSFSTNLFNVARSTSQSFDDVAKAAQEFARQGLGMTETLNRVNAAMTLSRQSGLDVEKSVNAITAAVNSFSKENISAIEIMNKLVAVDTRFAVSSADLAEALSRVGSTAQDAGVNFDQLVGLVTSAQQITARGGAVIGNALKTIFTRLERTDTLDQLQSLGIEVRNLEGNTRPAVEILQDLAGKFDNLSSSQKQAVVQLTAGVFQVNQLRAILGDLSKGYNIYTQAQQTSSTATNEAIKRNEVLNKSLSALLQNTKTTATQLGSAIGEKTFAEPLRKALSIINDNFVTESLQGAISGKAGESMGATVANGILQGIQNVLVGPGAIAVAAILGKLSARLLSDTVKSGLTTINGREKELKTMEGIQTVLQRSSEIDQQRFLTATSIEQKERVILELLAKQNALKAAQSGEIALLSRQLSGKSGAGLRTSNLADGFLPIGAEVSAISRGVGGASPSAKPVVLHNFSYGSGIKGTIVANSDEYIVPNFANGGSAIFNPQMVSKYGLPPGAQKIAAGGYIPTAADGFFGGASGLREQGVRGGLKSEKIEILNIAYALHAEGVLKDSALRKKEAKKLIDSINLTTNSQFIVADALKEQEKAIKLQIKQEIEQAKEQEKQKRQQEKINAKLRSKEEAISEQIVADQKLKQATNQQISNALSGIRARQTQGASGSQSGVYTPIAPTSLYNNVASNFYRQQAINNRPATSSEQDLGKYVEFLSNKQIEKVLSATGDKSFGNRKQDINNFRSIIGAKLVQKDPQGYSLNTERINSLIEFGRSGTLNDQYVTQVKKLIKEGITLENAYATASKTYLESGGTVRQLSKVQTKALSTLIDYENAVKLESAEVKKGEGISKALRRQNRLQTAGLAASFALPMAAGFVGEGQGGTTEGKTKGAISGFLQGAGTGAAVGSFLPIPGGALAGGLIGGAIGGLSGYIDKANKSFEELSKIVNDLNAKINEQIGAATNYIQLQQRLNDAIENGSSQKSIDRIIAQQRGALSTITSSEDRKNLLSAGGDLKLLSEAIAKMNDRSLRQGTQNDVISSLGAAANTGWFGSIKGKNIEDAAKAMSASLTVSGKEAETTFNKLKETFNSNPLDAFKEYADALGYDNELINGLLKQYKSKPEDLRLILKRFVDVHAENVKDMSKVQENQKRNAINIDYSKLLRLAGNTNYFGAEINQQNRLSLNRSGFNSEKAVSDLTNTNSLEKLRRENELSLRSATNETAINLQAALQKNISKVQVALSDQDTRGSIPQDVLSKLTTISTVDDFSNFAKLLGESNKELIKLLQDSYNEMVIQTNNSENSLRELQENNRISELLAKNEEKNRILSNAQFNANNINSYSGSRIQGRAGQFAFGGRALQYNELNSQIGFADQMGLGDSVNTQRLRNTIRAGSANAGFSAILSEISGESVGSTKEEMNAAIDKILSKNIKSLNDAVDQDVARRIQAGIKISEFDSDQAAAELSKGNVKDFLKAGKVSVAEGGLISSIVKLSNPLDEINQKLSASGPIADILSQIKENRALSAEDKARQDVENRKVELQKNISEAEKNIENINFSRVSINDLKSLISEQRNNAALRASNSLTEKDKAIALQQNKQSGTFFNYIKEGEKSGLTVSQIINNLSENKNKLNEIGLSENELKDIISLLSNKNPISFENSEKLEKYTNEIKNYTSALEDINSGYDNFSLSNIDRESEDNFSLSNIDRNTSLKYTQRNFGGLPLDEIKNRDAKKELIDIDISRTREEIELSKDKNATYEDRIDLLIKLNNLELQNAKITQDAYGSFSAGFKNKILEIRKSMNDLSDTGATIAASLESNLGNSFGDFVTGAKKGKDAFREFVVSVLNDSARAFASKAVQGLIGNISSGISNAFASNSTNTVTANKGGKIPAFASGGTVPALLTGGEYYFSPDQVKNIESKYGPGYVSKINSGTAPMYANGGMVKGGSGIKDDVFAMLDAGGYVIKKSSVKKYGPDTIEAIGNSNPQKRFWGGFMIGALIGGATSYATSDKKNRNKNALIGGVLGGIAGGMAQNASQTGSAFKSDPNASTFQFSSSSSGPQIRNNDDYAKVLNQNGGGAGQQAAQSPIKDALIQASIAGALGIGTTLAQKKEKIEEITQTPLTRQELELLQEQEIKLKRSEGQFAYLTPNNSGGQNILGYGYAPATRRFALGGPVLGGNGYSDNIYAKLNSGGAVIKKASVGKYGVSNLRKFADGGMVTANGSSSPLANTSSSNKSIQPNVVIKIDINNNGDTSSSEKSDQGNGAFGNEFAQKLSQNIRSIVKDELIQQGRTGGMNSQFSRIK